MGTELKETGLAISQAVSSQAQASRPQIKPRLDLTWVKPSQVKPAPRTKQTQAGLT
jgi:hypothetical protein